MLKIQAILKSRLKSARKVAILGVGSELRRDDVAGIIVAQSINEYIKKRKIKTIKVFLGRTAPENLTGEIKKFKPTHLIIIDAADIGQKAGSIGIIDAAKEGGSSFSTHRMPIHFIKDYLEQSVGCDVIIIGIQPKSISFGETISPEVQKSVKILSAELIDILKKVRME
jgi:hydrogenase 3 maturation protease